jgi:hypothetical protein
MAYHVECSYGICYETESKDNALSIKNNVQGCDIVEGPVAYLRGRAARKHGRKWLNGVSTIR